MDLTGDRMNRIVDDQDRILVSAELRSRLGLSPGMTLVVEEGDKDAVCLRLQSDALELVDKGGVLVVRARPLSDLTNVTQRERDRRVFDLLQRA
jgi:bifunctional DNA-binding transcriptional regulator/antitoxin component of YhaV-PrlF toxin-antitoxin module